MKRVFLILLCLPFFITTDVKALGMLPAIITSNDNSQSIAIEFLDGEYVLPEFCSTLGCTINIDGPSLIAIGKYNFDNDEKYFHISDGGGAVVYESGGDNYNKIEIDATSFKENGFVTINMGASTEKRTIKFVVYKETIVTDDNTISDNPIDGIFATGSDIETPIINTPTDNDNKTEPIVEISTNSDNTISKHPDKNMIIYIFIGIGILSVISATTLLSIRKRKLSNM